MNRNWTPNPSGKGLRSYPSKWNNRPTRQIRVPVIFSDELEEIAHCWDKEGRPDKVGEEAIAEMQVQQVIALLQEGLQCPANNSKKAKDKIREAIAILESY